MRIRKMLVLMGAVALIAADMVSAQSGADFLVEGDSRDWALGIAHSILLAPDQATNKWGWSGSPPAKDPDAAEPWATDPEAPSAGATLTGSEIDSSTVQVGVPALVIYGLGYRDPLTGEWPRLKQVRGVIQAVNSQRLLLAMPENAWPQRIDLPRIQRLILGPPSLLPAVSRDTLQAKTEPVPPVTVNGMPPALDTEDRGLRLLAKVAAGTASGIVVTAVAVGAQAARWEDTDPSRPTGGLEGLVFFVRGTLVGTMVGFPIGVTLVDPHDSFSMTLLGGVVPGLAGYVILQATRGSGISALAGMVTLLAPIVGSLHASEKSRRRPQDRRVSLGLSPTLNGGLSPVARLRF